jgi:ribosomal protein S27AE
VALAYGRGSVGIKENEGRPMVTLKPCPKCGFIILVEQIDFETMSYFFLCIKCNYVEFSE